MNEPTYSGEVQFAGYTDSSRSGPRVTLRLSDRADLDRFVGCEGKRYMLALVEIGDDEQAVAPPAESTPMGPLCKWAVQRQKDPAFIEWCGGYDPRAYILRVCNITSRKQLDDGPGYAIAFHNQIRKPFEAWCKKKGAA